jgi:hypothetical protein
MRVLDYTEVADVKVEVAAVIESCGCLWGGGRGGGRGKGKESRRLGGFGGMHQMVGVAAGLANGHHLWEAKPLQPSRFSRRRAEQLQTRTQNFTSGDRETLAYSSLHLLHLST